ncbi:GntR family transcriptional regulator [Marasmitruncus massiliensis]|uniref:GntR family transcriptional regulator n=1 Tax=Marasmitruncus massiliensis TaxID=1944642 RepID=UPI000C7D4DE9|nr:GntR family transcriptional regulator [Marasmitruncus massiliensis]MBE6907249.1 GntR family transcriptional regulator [Oscillospiraceae bacterium]
MGTTSQTSANLSQVIYQHLWYEISTLHLKPGEKLSEVKLARQFNCSRIPVREAIHLLVADGALETQSQRGSFVTLIDLEQLERIRYLREALEIKIMMDGYRSGCFDPIIPYLESLVARQEELMNASAYEIAFQMDIEFHKIFYNLTKKEFVLDHTGEKDIHYLRARLLSLQHESPIIMPSQHRAIINAIKVHDDDALEKAVYHHLNNVNILIQDKQLDLESYFRH